MGVEGRRGGSASAGAAAGELVLMGTGKARYRAVGASSGLTKTGEGVHGCSVVGTRKNSLIVEQ